MDKKNVLIILIMFSSIANANFMNGYLCLDNSTDANNLYCRYIADSNNTPVYQNMELYNGTNLEDYERIYHTFSDLSLTFFDPLNLPNIETSVFCNISIWNDGETELYDYIELNASETFNLCATTTTTSTTTTSTTSTTEASTTTTEATTTTEGTTTSTSGGTTSSSGGTSSSSVAGTTLYGYSFPHGDHGTLPSLNGTGGNTINNGSIKNMTCTGWCIIGLKKEEFQLYAAIMIIIIALISIKPFKLGATASAVALLFFNNILGWTTITASLMIIFVFIALATWFMEGKK
jgi:hypothetical protein